MDRSIYVLFSFLPSFLPSFFVASFVFLAIFTALQGNIRQHENGEEEKKVRREKEKKNGAKVKKKGIDITAADLDKGKGKVPPGCLLAEPITQVTRFSMPLEPSFGTVPLSSTLS